MLKSEEMVDTYGSIDELNSWVGLIVSEMDIDHLKRLLQEIQSDLFIVGGYLAGWPARDASQREAGGKTDLSVLETRVPQMEVEIDAMDKELPRLSNFILPGGSPQAAHIHIARNVCRRIERRVVALTKRRKIDSSIIKYLNRLSDLFFIVARYINKKAGIEDVLWLGVPRSNKK